MRVVTRRSRERRETGYHSKDIRLEAVGYVRDPKTDRREGAKNVRQWAGETSVAGTRQDDERRRRFVGGSPGAHVIVTRKSVARRVNSPQQRAPPSPTLSRPR